MIYDDFFLLKNIYYYCNDSVYRNLFTFLNTEKAVAWPSGYDTGPRREAGGFLMSPLLSGISGLSVLFHFSMSPVLFFCPVLPLFLSYPFCF